MIDTFENYHGGHLKDSGLSRSASDQHPNTSQPEERHRPIHHVASPSAPTRRAPQDLVNEMYKEFEEFSKFEEIYLLASLPDYKVVSALWVFACAYQERPNLYIERVQARIDSCPDVPSIA